MLATIAVLLMAPVSVAQDSPQTAEGVATFARTGRPAAGLSLQISERPDPRYLVVVDEQGRFRAPAPPGWHVPRPGEELPPCSAVAEPEGRWRIELINTPPFRLGPEQLRQIAAQGMSQRARLFWRNGGFHVECPEPGEVDVLVRGADGRPMSDRPVVVVPDAAAFRAFGPVNARFSGRTDDQGRFRMRWFEGVRRLQVTIPGEGTCSTPKFRVAPGETTSVDTLPMAGLGSIAGRLAPRLVGPNVHVVIDPAVRGSQPCGPDGRFEFRDLPPGRYLLRLDRGNPGVPSAQVTVWLAPGGKVDGLLIDETPPPTPEETARRNKIMQQFNGRQGPNDRDDLWIEGTVRDVSGGPLPGVDVFVRTSYHGGIRMEEDVRRTTTDAQGRYAISGPVRGFVGGLAVIAKGKGRPPVVAHAQTRSTQHDQVSRRDLTLADTGGSASVTVLGGGKPAAGVPVSLMPEGGANILFGGGWARSAGGPARSDLDAILIPKATTDRNGLARFTELLPGRYTIHAGAVQVHGLAVARDWEAKANVEPGAPRPDARFLVVRPDGRPVVNQDVTFQFTRSGEPELNSNLKLGDDGTGGFALRSTGVWSVVVRFRDEPVHSFPIVEPPYYEAEAQVAVSPALRSTEPVRLVGVRRERESGSVLVRLLDVEGRPSRGVVALHGVGALAEAIGSTDERGEIRFEGLTEDPSVGRLFATGWLEGPTPPPWSTAGPPPDDALRGRFAIAPGVEVKIVPGREQTMELRARPAGYIRGALHPAEGRRTADYAVYPWFNHRGAQPNWRYDPATGDFLAGPFVGGPATIQFAATTPDGGQQNCGKQVVEVVPGDVARVELRPGGPEPPADQDARQRAVLGMLGVSVPPDAPQPGPVVVLLPDGKTPAYGAQAVLYAPGENQPVARGISDGGGRMTWSGAWRIIDPAEKPGAGLVDRPTLAASLPGRHGASIVPLEDDEEARRVVLPPAINAGGAVRIGGRPPDGDGSLVRVVAAHQGRGVLDAALSVATTAGPDGRFTLDGLTPGRYLVQAARDEVWASKPVEMRVEPGQPTPPLALEIPAIGETVTLEIVDRGGEPLAGEVFTLARPAGPFASIRPPTVRADASGRLTFRGLEAGPHSISSPISSESAGFDVAPASEGDGRPAVKRIVMRRPEP